MLLDTHAHLYFDRFDEDRADVLRHASEAGLEAVVMPAVGVESIGKAVQLCEQQPADAPTLYAMAALHPSEAKSAPESDLDAVADWCGHESIVAVGETGLDHYHDRSFDERQERFLRAHIRLALEKDLPLILHHRNATDAVLDLLDAERRAADHPPDRLRGILHCFTGSPAQAERATRLGFLIGLGGILTFTNSDLDDAVADIPLGETVVETDAPYLAPEPHRGKRNEPAFVRDVAEYLAEVKGVSLEEVARITTANARQIYDLDGGPRTTDGGPQPRQ